MKKNFKNFYKKIGVVVVTLVMLIMMFPGADYSADMGVVADDNDTFVSDYDETTTVTITTDKPEVVFDEEHLTGEITCTATVSGNEKEISHLVVGYEVAYGQGYTYEDSWEYEPVGNGIFKSGLFFENPVESRVYRVISVCIIYEDDTEAMVKNIPTTTFSTVNNLSDKEAPVITEVTMDKLGQYIEDGMVTITMKAEDETGLADYAFVYLQSPYDIENSYVGYEMSLVEISEDAKSGVYSATIDVSELYPCEWYISDFGVWDIYNNYEFIYGYEEEYYFYVCGEGFIEETYDEVTFCFSDGFYGELAGVTLDNVPRRVTLGEVFGDDWIDSLPATEESGAFLGWMYGDEFVTKDSIVTVNLDDSYFVFEPKFERDCVIIRYEHLNGNKYCAHFEKTYIDEGLTYGELKEMMQVKEETSYKFTGWFSFYDDDEIIENTYVDLYAEYEKYPVTVKLAYIDESGALKIVEETKDFDAGTTYKEILSAYAPNVEKWVFRTEEANDEEISISGLYIEEIGCDDDKQIVYYFYYGIGDAKDSQEYGVSSEISEYMVVEKENEFTEEQLFEKVKHEIVPNHFDKLTLVDEGYGCIDYNDDGFVDEVYIYPVYKESMVNIFYQNDIWSDYIFDEYYVVNAGETFYLPKEYAGEKVYWGYGDEYYTGSFRIPAEDKGGETYYLSMTTELPEGAILHENPSKPVVIEGWKKDNVGWWYQNANGTYPSSCWKMISGKWYAFDARGYMREGWFYDAGKWYYLIPGSGQMATGWVQVGGIWYYMNTSGAMVTGWLKDGSTWYYMKSSGAMATGWVKDGNTWYYMKSSGAMATGWVKDGNTWYYMKSSGAMATGWVKDGNTWYYMKSSGAMATGWILDGGTWYYLNSSGAWVA